MRSKLGLLFGLLLAGCASTSVSAPRNAGERLPGLSGASGLQSDAGRYQPAPAAIAEFLLSLPTRDVLVPRELRQRYLQGKAYVVEVARPQGAADYLVIDQNGPKFGFWLRSFQGSTPGVTGYLLQVRAACSDIVGASFNEPAVEAQRICGQPRAERVDSGLRAYRIVAGKAPMDVTHTLANPNRTLGGKRLQRYRALGANAVAIDDSRLDRVPALRWVVESDPEQPLPADDERSFEAGGMAHGGFLVWTGDRFVVRDSVPRSLWPCAADDQAHCADPDNDRFVTPGK